MLMRVTVLGAGFVVFSDQCPRAEVSHLSFVDLVGESGSSKRPLRQFFMTVDGWRWGGETRVPCMHVLGPASYMVGEEWEFAGARFSFLNNKK